MRRTLYILSSLACAAALMARPVCAQQQPNQTPDQTQQPVQDPNATSENPSQPIPAIRSPLAGINGNDQDDREVTQKTLPDTTPLSGIENISLGRPRLDHNYVQPQFEIFTTADSDELSAKGNPGWGDFTSFLGGVDLHQAAGVSNLALSYLGGGTIAVGGTAGDSVLQQLGVTETLTWSRTKLTFVDQLSLLPESSFGYAGLGGGVALPGGGSTGLQNGLTPGDSVLTTRGLRLSNSFLTEGDIFLTPRSSITLAGGYSLLHYFDNTLIDFGDVIFQAGFNRQMTRKDTFAVFYRFSGYRYSGFNQSINDNSFQVSYGRRVTGRLSFQVAAGPDVAFVTQPITGSTATTTTSSAKQEELYWSLNTNVQYQLERTGFAGSYNHGVSGGSGVLAGSIADTATGSANRRLTRALTGGLSVGYSHNKGLNLLGTTPTSQSYGYWFGGVNFTRTWGRALDLNLNYLAQYQTSSSAFCVGPTCATSLLRHQISIGVNWHRQPIPF
jgi:hypothetical protein